MSHILGIDLGTSSVKSMLIEDSGKIVEVSQCEYPINRAKPGFAEQDPIVWWESVIKTLNLLKSSVPIAFNSIKAIGLSGQMHGVVIVDKKGIIIRPAIIWLDQRSGAQIKKINEIISEEEIISILHNRPATGFAFPSLLWLQENEAHNFNKIYKILHPKDYIRYRLTGKLETDVSDASASSCFDLPGRNWSYEITRRFTLPDSIFPEAHESTEIAGYVTSQCSKETGIKEGVPVIYGCGDQPAQSIGNGAILPGVVISNIGTGGQVSTYSENDAYDSSLRVHTFCHAINKAYTIFGAILCGGISLKWLKNDVINIKSFKSIDKMAKKAPPGSKGLIFLPYLSGERTPHMDSNAKGMFFRLTLEHDRNHFARSVMEGVCYALKNSLDILERLGLKAESAIASGGGASSDIWLQIQADILEKEILVSTAKEQSALGACLLAGVGAGIYKDIKEACGAGVRFKEKTYQPIDENCKIYREAYGVYNELYLRNSDLF